MRWYQYGSKCLNSFPREKLQCEIVLSTIISPLIKSQRLLPKATPRSIPHMFARGFNHHPFCVRRVFQSPIGHGELVDWKLGVKHVAKRLIMCASGTTFRRRCYGL